MYEICIKDNYRFLQQSVFFMESYLHSACIRIYSDGLFYFMQLQQL